MSDQDLDLLAFRYIAGELNQSEEAAWEARLERSQAARDAVTRAVEIAEAVVSIPAMERAPAPIPLRRPWRGVAAAAVLAVLGGGWWAITSTESTELVPAPSEELVSLWLEFGADPLPIDLEDAELAKAQLPETNEDEVVEGATPVWVLDAAAVDAEGS